MRHNELILYNIKKVPQWKHNYDMLYIKNTMNGVENVIALVELHWKFFDVD